MNEVENTPLEKRDKEHCETIEVEGNIYIENTPVKEWDQGRPNSGSTPVKKKVIEQELDKVIELEKRARHSD